MKKSLIGIVAAIFGFTAVFFMAAYYWLYVDEDAAVGIAENALARDGLVFIGHVDVEKIQAFHRLSYGEADPSPLPPLMVDTSLVNALFSGESALREQIGQAVFGFRVSEDGGSSMNFVLNGNIASADLKKLLAKNFAISDEDNGGFMITRLPDQKRMAAGEEFDCPEEEGAPDKKAPLKMALVHSGDWLVGSRTIDDARAILQRIENRDKAIVNIDRWQQFRKGKLLSLGIVDPENTRRSPMGMLSMLLPRTKDTNRQYAFTEAYVGAGINLASRALLVTSEIIAEPAWAKEQADKFAAKKAEFVESAKGYSVTLAGLAENLDVTSEAGVLQVLVNIPHDLVEKMPEIIGEVISGMFSNAFGGKSSSANAQKTDKEKPVDQIDDNPWDYSINNNFAGLQDFSPDQHFLPQQVNGAFGYSLEKVAFDKETGLIEVSFEANFNLPELQQRFWSDSGLQATLWINDANGVDGNSLLRDERCVKKLQMFARKNQSPEKSAGFSNGVGNINKTIRLVEGASFQALKTISGVLEVSMPTRVSRQRMEARVGEIIEVEGLRLYVRKVEPDGIVLAISGDEKRIVEIRGINPSGKVLRSRGMSGFGLEGNISKHASFAGNLKAVDIFIVDKYTTLKDEFVFDVSAVNKASRSVEFKYHLLEKPGKVTRAEWQAFHKADPGQFSQSVTSEWKKSNGHSTHVPVDIRIEHDKDSSWNHVPEFTLTVPLINKLVANYGFVELVIEPKNRGGSPISLPFLIKPPINSINGGSPYYGYSVKIGDQPFMRDNQKIDLGYEQGEAIDVVEGVINIRLPQLLNEQKIDFPGIGKSSEINGRTVTLQEIDFDFNEAYELKYTGSLDDFVSILTVTDSGEIYNPIAFRKDSDGVLVDLPFVENIAHLVLVTADRHELITYPFTIKIDYSKNEKK